MLPHLRVNTTSVSRFKSIIEAAINQGNRAVILEFLYPLQKSIGLGQQPDKQQKLENYITSNLIPVSVKLNFIQKVAFYFLNTFEKPYWKAINWIHQIVHHNDIFYPGTPLISQRLPIDNRLETIVIAFGGPFGIFSYAEKLAELYNGKLVLDYRDPWTFGYKPLDSSSLLYKLKKSVLRKREVKLLKKATLITTVSNTLKGFFPEEYQHKVEVFENGTAFGAEDLNYPLETDIFSIVYSGTIYNNQLHDDVFFEAFKAFVKDKDPANVKSYIIGAIDNSNLVNKINAYGLGAYMHITPRISHDSMLVYLQKASVFLHLRYGSERGIITSKQADYLFFKKPILLPVSDNGDIAESITRYNAGYICNSVNENYQVLQSLWEKFSRNEDVKLKSNNFYLDLTRKEIAVRFLGKLSDI